MENRNQEQRIAIKSCAKLGKTASETYAIIVRVYGDSALSRAQVFRWHKEFKEGRESVEDEARSGRPVEARTDANAQRVCALIRENPRLTVRMLASELNMNRETVRQILTDDFGISYIHNRAAKRIEQKKERNANYIEKMEDVRKRVHDEVESGAEGAIVSTGNNSSTTIPKKRGRPSNPDKVKKTPTGRGRGRAAKNSDGKKNVGEPVSEDDTPVAANGGRGRPSKSVGSTLGKGRGRPKKQPQASEEDDDDVVEEDDDKEDEQSDYKRSGKKPGRKPKSPKKVGRPKKAVSEDEDEESGEDKRVTGRGRGKKVAAVAAKRPATAGANGGVPKKRGRPAGSKKSTPGRPGRKPAKEVDSADDSQDKEDNDDMDSSEDDHKKSKNKDDTEEDTGANSNEEDDLADGKESAA